MKYPFIIKDFLKSCTTPDFAGLITVASEIKRIEGILRQRLDPETSRHVRLGEIAGGELTLYVDSPAWAGRLRFESGDIISIINKIEVTSSIHSIKIHVMPKLSEPAIPPREKSPVHASAEFAHLVEALAEGETDPILKASLAKLARKGRVGQI